MPLPMVHLDIARRLVNAGYKVEKLPQFYLGVISPDAIHMRKDSDRQHKNDTHFIPAGKRWVEVDEKEYILFMKDFVQKNLGSLDDDFLRGYALHIITDMLWTQQVYQRFVGKYKEDPAPIQAQQMAYYNDADILDQEIYNESDWRPAVWEQLVKSESNDFLDLLSREEINLWKERTLHWFDEGVSKHKNPVKYIFLEDILAFADSCTTALMKEEIY